jgi:hypothetical protein
MAIEPMADKRWISVTECRAQVDWAVFIKDLFDVHYPNPSKFLLAMDNLNTHGTEYLYDAFRPENLLRLATALRTTLHQSTEAG